MAEFFEAKKGGFNNFQKLKCLEQLKLLNDVGSSMSKVLQLPHAFLGFLRRLHKLTLSNTRFVWSDANKLGQLECLEVLKLKENAFCGTAWDSVGFSKLKVLWIERATDLETWKSSNFSFQRLKYLVLKSCDKLEAVPFEFAGVTSLQEMTLNNTKKANKSAKAIEGRKMQELMRKVAERKTGTDCQAPESFKFKLTIFPPESADCDST
uniref:Uncharacterized protein LOC104232578 n=1 Tax=Nicotiana sylvestris TaxID=4096 RepID=A0A1U7XB10_NICSY|nr:PREDICTED: uncharacterized protein LOC104232578 [Nicotiana sylvestris]